MQQRVVLLLDHLVLLLDGLQVGLHGGDLPDEEISHQQDTFGGVLRDARGRIQAGEVVVRGRRYDP